MKTNLKNREGRAWELAHPGAILRAEFLVPRGVTQAELARRTGIPASRWTEIIRGRRSITAETALALGLVFGMDARFWMNLQAAHDLREARRLHGAVLEGRVEPLG